jgi:hypothetical protein
VLHVPVDGVQCLAELGRGWWGVRCQQRSQEPVVDFGVEDRDPLAIGGQYVGVAVREAFDQPVATEAGKVDLPRALICYLMQLQARLSTV